MNEEQYEAVFIGGEFDLTKRVLKRKESRVYFHSKRASTPVILGGNSEQVEIYELVYYLQGETEKGVLVYEYSHTKDLK